MQAYPAGKVPFFFEEFAPVTAASAPLEAGHGWDDDDQKLDRVVAGASLAGPSSSPRLGVPKAQIEQASTATIDDITAQVIETAQVILGRRILSDQPLMEAGLDSLAAVELRNALASKFGLDLPPTAMFDYPTAVALASFVAVRLPMTDSGSLLYRSGTPWALEQSRIQVRMRRKHRQLSRQRNCHLQPPSTQWAGGLAANYMQQVSGLVESVLGIKVDADQPLIEGGLDSLGAVELRNTLAQAFGMDLPPTLLFDYPSISRLAGHIATAAQCGTDQAALEQEEEQANGSDSGPGMYNHHPRAPTRRGSPPARRAKGVDGRFAQQVSALVQVVLGTSVSADQPLMEAGLDSLSAVELRNSLSQKFGVELPPTVLFDYPSTAAMSRFLAGLVETPGAGGSASLVANDNERMTSDILEVGVSAELILEQ